MKLFVRSLCLLSIAIFEPNFLICMNVLPKTEVPKTEAPKKCIPTEGSKNIQHTGALNSWASIVKALPAVSALPAKPVDSNLKQAQSIKITPDDQFLQWLSGEISEPQKPIIGNAFTIIFNATQTRTCKIDRSKPVVVFSWKALRHTLNPWFVDGKNFVEGGHFARYLRSYSDSENQGAEYFFNTKKATYVGNSIRPCSKHQQHPRCEVILWASNSNYKKEWRPAAIKTVFDASVTLFEVLNTAANCPVDICVEPDDSYSFVISEKKLPYFKVNTRWNESDGFYYIVSIYPLGNQYGSITDNMCAYFDNQFREPSDSILHEISL